MTTDKAAQVAMLLDEATEKIRAATRTAGITHPTPDNTYTRAGALVSLLRAVEHATLDLHRAVAGLNPARLFSDDGAVSPHLAMAEAMLNSAAGSVGIAETGVGEAWSALSHLGTQEDRT